MRVGEAVATNMAAMDPTARVRTTRRRGRMTSAKWSALGELGPTWGVPLHAPHVLEAEGLTAAFGRDAPRLLDVGTGSGEATRAWAAAHPRRAVMRTTQVAVPAPATARGASKPAIIKDWRGFVAKANAPA